MTTRNVVAPSHAALKCPECATEALKVSVLTVRSLVRQEWAGQIHDGPYAFCPSPGCDVVYFALCELGQRFLRAQVRVRVGLKESYPPMAVCYCFDWTTDDIERDLRLTGTTTIPDRIKEKIQQGYCQCETMNPQGSCCLGNVNRAVKEARDKLALPARAAAGLARPRGQGSGTDTVATAPAKKGRTKERGAFLATLGAASTAVMGSACCWLPLLLIAFGFSVGGVGSFFEQYRPYFLTATFVLLGAAWYFTYRVTIRRAWIRARGKQAPVPAVEACCGPEATLAAVHSCCAAGSVAESENCCAPPAGPTAGRAAPQRFTMRHFNQVMLWMATVMIVLLALFPQWVGLALRGGGSNAAAAVNPDDQEQIGLEVKDMTCEGCAATVRQALGKVPGVARVEVRYSKGEAVVTTQPGRAPDPEALLRAVREAGYTATVKRQPQD